MNLRLFFAAGALVLLVGAGCGKEPGSTTLTKGSLVVACDEAIFPVVQTVAEEFVREYPDSRISVRSAQARSATADFVNDSIRVIVVARPLNAEERNVLAIQKAWMEEHHVAQSALAIIVHPDNRVKELRLGEVDSMFAGLVTRWPDTRRPIDLVIGGINASANEVLRSTVLKGKPFALSATPMDSSDQIVAYVHTHRDALGMVGVNWLKDREGAVSVVGVSRPGMFLDSSQTVGTSYVPAQAYVYKNWYAITTPVMVYTREVNRDISLGFISFIASAPGQKIFLNSGLVPMTQPVRLISLTSEQVQRK